MLHVYEGLLVPFIGKRDLEIKTWTLGVLIASKPSHVTELGNVCVCVCILTMLVICMNKCFHIYS